MNFSTLRLVGLALLACSFLACGGGTTGGVGGGSGGGSDVDGGSGGGGSMGGGAGGGGGGGGAGGGTGGAAGGGGGGVGGGSGGGSGGGDGGFALDDNSDCAESVVDSNVVAYQTFSLALDGFEPRVAYASLGRMIFASRSTPDAGWAFRLMSADPGGPQLTQVPGRTLVAVRSAATTLYSVRDGGVSRVLGPYPVPMGDSVFAVTSDALASGGAQMTQLVQHSSGSPELRTHETDAGETVVPLPTFPKLDSAALARTADGGIVIGGIDSIGRLWAGPHASAALIFDGGVSAVTFADATSVYFRVNSAVLRLQLPSGPPQVVVMNPLFTPQVAVAPSGQHMMLLRETLQNGSRLFRFLAETGGVFREERRFSADWVGPITLLPDGRLATLSQTNRTLTYRECPRR